MDKFERLAGRIVGCDMVGQVLDGSEIDLVVSISKDQPVFGLVFNDEALLLDRRTWSSFRVKTGNLGIWKNVRCYKSKKEINKSILMDYFNANNDNPYALQHIMDMLYHNRDMGNLTQYPPLVLRNYTKAQFMQELNILLAGIQPGDLVFSTDLKSNISAAIRKYDCCQYSHVAAYIGDSMVADLGPGGYRENSLLDYGEHHRIAGYSFFKEISEHDRKRMSAAARDLCYSDKIKFSYLGLLGFFLRNRFRLPIMKKEWSVSDHLSSNIYRLVGYV